MGGKIYTVTGSQRGYVSRMDLDGSNVETVMATGGNASNGWPSFFGIESDGTENIYVIHGNHGYHQDTYAGIDGNLLKRKVWKFHVPSLTIPSSSTDYAAMGGVFLCDEFYPRVKNHGDNNIVLGDNNILGKYMCYHEGGLYYPWHYGVPEFHIRRIDTSTGAITTFLDSTTLQSGVAAPTITESTGGYQIGNHQWYPQLTISNGSFYYCSSIIFMVNE